MIWLRIESEPPRQFYRNADALPYLAADEARHALLLSAGALRAGSDETIQNVTVSLQNASAECAALFVNPPLNVRAELHNESGIVYAGTISSIALGSPCEVRIEG